MNAVFDLANQCLSYLTTIKISDLVDIFVIAYLFYRLLLIAQSSRAGQVLRGVVIIVAVLWLANIFNLNVLSYILGKAFEMGLLALVVVFQPEMRHFLEQMGSNKFSNVFHSETRDDEMSRAIDQLVDAYATMSREKVGALTVFERTTILDDCIKNGTALDCELSSELLKNIFWPKAPLHDGAVMVRGGRIVAAGCVLPLSENQNISRELGTRHRAGIGMTEHTDAVVAICSEETGSISVAVHGTLKRHLAPETLRRLLRNELMPQNSAAKDGSEKKHRLHLGPLSGIFRNRREDSNSEE